MAICALVDELNKLRKSSSESIDNEKNFDAFKRYMHIKRNVETDLKILLRRVSDTKRKTLILLCGSAGDGKSHILSYLKNVDGEHLLENYRIHNDATESSAPTKTAIQTLNDVLDDFSDEKIDLPGGNLILAINLGVLNNFIESTYGARYQGLKNYVESHYILSSKVYENQFDANSHFQHISFADYQLYTLTEKGAKSQYIESILQRIFSESDENPFAHAFNDGCGQCPLRMDCPVRYNFSFMKNENVRKYISDLMVMTIVKDKEIVTTREMLNYFYDILVPQDFTYQGLSQNLLNREVALNDFITSITPSLIFGQTGVTALMDHIKTNDPLLFRNEENDDFAIAYYVSLDDTKVVEDVLKNTPYKGYFLRKENIEIENQNREIRGKIFGALIRIDDMKQDHIRDSIYEDYIKTLFYYNAGKIKKLGPLYESVEKAVKQWCGTDGEGHIRLNMSNREYSLYESINFDADVQGVPKSSDAEELQKFSTELHVGFIDHKNSSMDVIGIDIDYALFKLIKQLNKGYIHTANDRNDHADFIGFSERLLKTGTADQEVIIVSSTGERSTLEKTKFGYRFGVAR